MALVSAEWSLDATVHEAERAEAANQADFSSLPMDMELSTETFADLAVTTASQITF